MRNELRIIGLLAVGLMGNCAVAQSGLPVSSLRELQTKAAQGEHRTVRVEGVYLTGLEAQYLVTSGCGGRSISIDFELTTHRLWKQIVRLSNQTNTQKHVTGDGDPVLVVFEGEFYGPQAPDPKLPEAIRENYHPGWDHMNVSIRARPLFSQSRLHDEVGSCEMR